MASPRATSLWRRSSTPWLEAESFYNPFMLDENDFRKRADAALESLKQSLITAEESADLEVEDQSGALHISFGDGARFVISPNAPVRQIWISALATSFKLDWSDANQDFVLQKTGEELKPLVSRLINQQLGEEIVTLG
jgi:iron donor protein CyaY